MKKILFLLIIHVFLFQFLFASSQRAHQIEAGDYLTLNFPVSVLLSPDSKYIAYTEMRWTGEDEKRDKDLWIVSVKNKTKKRLTFDGLAPGNIAWSNDSKSIYFTASISKAEHVDPPYNGKTQVYKISISNPDPFPITREEKGVSLFQITSDEKFIYYTSSEQVFEDDWKEMKEGRSDIKYGHGVNDYNPIFKYDVENWKSEKILDAKKVIWSMHLSPDDSKLAMHTTTGNELIYNEGWSDVEVLDLKTNELKKITEGDFRKNHKTPYGWLEEIAWAYDSKTLAFSLGFDGYPCQLYAASITGDKSKTWKLSAPKDSDVTGHLKWYPGKLTLMFLAEIKAHQYLYGIEDVKDSKQGDFKLFTKDPIVVHDFDMNKEKKIALIKQSGLEFEDIFLLKADKFDKITELNPQTSEWILPQIQIVKWEGADGDIVEGILELPAGYKKSDGPLPTIIEIHGGPTASTKDRIRFWIYGRTLMASKGYALLSPNYHGSTGYGEKFMTKLIGRENDIEVEDIVKGTEYLISQGIADKEKIGVMGWSNGGYLTNCLIVKRPDLYKAASSGAGVLDMVIEWGIEDTPGHVINYMKGFPWEKQKAYVKASPLYELNKVKTPTLIHFGENDARVPIAHATALHRALHYYLKVPTQLIVYPDEGHSLQIYKNRLLKMQWDLAWFEKYLLKTEKKEDDKKTVR
ncbi:MAG: prolyl oligopeptidase family serine peptidase [Pseudomonadota bacterium]